MAAIKYPTIYMPCYALAPPACIKAYPVADDYKRKLATYLNDPKAFLSAYRVFKDSIHGNWDAPYGYDEYDLVHETFLCVASCTISIMRDVSNARTALDKKAVISRHMRLVGDERCPRAALARAVAVDRCVQAGAKPQDIAKLVMMYVDRESVLQHGV
jgi:hypothetical protein